MKNQFVITKLANGFQVAAWTLLENKSQKGHLKDKTEEPLASEPLGNSVRSKAMKPWWKTFLGFLVQSSGQILMDPTKVIYIFSPNRSFQTVKAII